MSVYEGALDSFFLLVKDHFAVSDRCIWTVVGAILCSSAPSTHYDIRPLWTILTMCINTYDLIADLLYRLLELLLLKLVIKSNVGHSSNTLESDSIL